MSDIYDRWLVYYKRHPEKIAHHWMCAFPLFRFIVNNEIGSNCGCPAMIKFGNCRIRNAELNQIIQETNFPDLSAEEVDYTNLDLTGYAVVQRAADWILDRDVSELQPPTKELNAYNAD